MKYLLLIYGEEQAERPSPELMDEIMGEYGAQRCNLRRPRRLFG